MGENEIGQDGLFLSEVIAATGGQPGWLVRRELDASGLLAPKLHPTANRRLPADKLPAFLDFLRARGFSVPAAPGRLQTPAAAPLAS